ncbi:putative membrane protein [Asticcacaulis biprosthecium C19]|uniref:Putative membrane protein n=1 Tax=Asticcacaulis biprosthecium C19 TaxID=715226 RepID=F4QTK5_9CAUL|nr:hypothetical protein [Asticcacaulis biprosthecium]EGF90075.1 putative membrane protein [Asticcacaulis biprosthecium C19]
MTPTTTLNWRQALLAGVMAAAAVLAAAFLLLAVSRLTQPTPTLKNAFAARQLVSDEAAHRAFTKLGRVRADCETAGLILAVEKSFGRYMFAPQLPKDPDEVLNTCQTVRDLAYGDPGLQADTRSAKVNPIALRGVTRLALGFIPLQIWQIALAVAALAIGGATAFFLVRTRRASVVKLAVLGAASLIAALFAATSLSLGIGALLWPTALAAAFFVSEKSPWRLLAVCGLLGAGAVAFDYGAALGVTVLLSLLFGLAVQNTRPGLLLTCAAAYLGAAATVVIILALAQANVRGFGFLATLPFVIERFTDGVLLLGDDGAAIAARSGERIGKLLARYNGWSAIALYAGLCAVAFSGWALWLKGHKGLGVLILGSAAGIVLWSLFAFDRLSAQPLQFASLPLLLLGYTLASVVATLVVKPSTPLEPAS